ncbi:transcription factor [Nitrososphaera viennensis]|uniref:Transcription factor E n=2 Tax=Nitrososphaera viennensis TaxID=1034015 RepID=A0A060HLC0_9ARCH|nr:transcription factor [Nitrososphaera viennensis]AIC16298.1 transcription factor E [Nitrososphaera viennensis EN76]UVS68235.1 transcription factor [Nitrososphaera viennensis]
MHAMDYEDSFVKIAGLIGGEEYVKVSRALLNTEDVTDEEIASATGLKINIVRKVLYDLFGKALITGIRVKDEKKGWFVYRWRAKQDHVDNFIENQKKKILDRLHKRLEHEDSTEFYHCGNHDCPRVKFDTAVELFFKCPNCKGPLNMVDNSRVKEALRYKIDQITTDIINTKANAAANKEAEEAAKEEEEAEEKVAKAKKGGSSKPSKAKAPASSKKAAAAAPKPKKKK